MKKKANNILYFLHFSERLKNELRNGYTSLDKRESVAEHSWRVALLVILVAPYLDIKIDVERALKMAVIHDLVEAISGDTPCFEYEYDNEKKLEVQSKEHIAMLSIKKMLPHELGNEIYNLWADYEQGLSYEGKFVKAIDKAEAQVQHNEMNFSHWNEFDLTYALEGLNEYCDFDSFLKILKDCIQEESKKKIKHNISYCSNTSYSYDK